MPKYRNFSEDDYLDSDVAVNFFRHFLIEGIAGSGKTSAVAKEIVAILGKSDAGKELLSNVWFVHATKEDAIKYGFLDKEFVSIKVKGEKAGILENVYVRVNDSFSYEVHLDTDDANAFLIKNGDEAELIVE